MTRAAILDALTHGVPIRCPAGPITRCWDTGAICVGVGKDRRPVTNEDIVVEDDEDGDRS